jgi:glyoxylase-like metal-dependent hydrolase (beta-lactamase superfamily II)
MKRDAVIRFSLLGLALLILVFGRWARAQPGFETTRIAEGVYQFRWQTHNALFITTPAGVVAVDPIGVEAAHQLGREIQRTAPNSPLFAIVYSHSDADHSTGAAALMSEMRQENVQIIAHEKAVAPILELASPDQALPTVTFSDRFTFYPGGRRIELHYLGPSHTDNMIVPFVPDAGVAFAVDFASNDRLGYMFLPGWQFPDFFSSLARLLDIPFQTVVFGHGQPGNRATIQRQIAYYDDLTAAVRRAMADGLSEDQAAERIRLPAYASWDQYAAWLPLNVRAVYQWLAGAS